MPGNFETISPGNSLIKRAAQTVPLMILALLAAAIIYYKERMLFIDAPHVFFRVINDGQLHLEEHRFGSFITQIVPLLGAKLHLPFKFLIVLYSASFYLFYLSAALLLVYAFRNYRLAILFGLYLTLLVSDTYYWPNNEVHQGIAWLMIAFAGSFCLAEKKKPVIFTIIVFAASFYLAIWTHPLVMLVAVYLWFFMWLSGCSWPFTRWQSALFTIILLALSYLKFHQGNLHGYDATKIEVMTNFKLQNIKMVFGSPMLQYFLKTCISNYWLFTLLFMAGLIALLKEKKYLLFVFTAITATGYLLLICIEFRDVSSNRFYIESEYMPIAIIACAPFVYFLLPKINPKAAVGVLVAVFVVRLCYICSAAAPFSDRVAILNSINAKMKEKNLTKVIIPEPVRGVDSALILNWGAPVESIILSKLKGENPQRTFIFLEPNLFFLAKNMGTDTMLGCWEKRPKGKINGYYFQPDTTVPYSIVSYEELMK